MGKIVTQASLHCFLTPLLPYLFTVHEIKPHKSWKMILTNRDVYDYCAMDFASGPQVCAGTRSASATVLITVSGDLQGSLPKNHSLHCSLHLVWVKISLGLEKLVFVM